MNKILIALTSLLVMTGCYHVGVPGGRAVAFDEVVLTNKTHEPTLARQFDMAFKEQVSVTPGVHGKTAKNAVHYNVDIELTSIRNLSIARAEVRAKQSSHDKNLAYQTCLNRVHLTAKAKP